MKSKTISGLIDFSVVAFLVFIICMMLFWGCRHDPAAVPAASVTADQGNGNPVTYNETACDPDSTYFENQILPLFISNCAKSGCHDAAAHEEGFVFNSFD